MPRETVVTKSTEMPWAKLDSVRDADTKDAYAEVSSAADRKQGAFAVLQKLARSFVRWDDTADKSVTRELTSLAKMPLNEDNTTFQNGLALINCFQRALVSSIDNDPRRNAEYLDDKKRAAYERDKAVRAAFRDALGGDDEKVKTAIAVARGKAAKTGDKDGE